MDNYRNLLKTLRRDTQLKLLLITNLSQCMHISFVDKRQPQNFDEYSTNNPSHVSFTAFLVQNFDSIIVFYWKHLLDLLAVNFNERNICTEEGQEEEEKI